MKQPKFIYTGIHVSNLDRAIRFYTKELGMDLLFKSRTIKETGGKVAWLRGKGSKQILELNWYPRGHKFGAGSGLDHLAFHVDDVEEAYSRLIEKNEGVLKPFVEGRWKLAFVKDPDGNWIELGEILRKKRRRKSG
jgi:catechol 2,3-dioxygenase-like lactoylglutathione lyase family enzyme